MHHLSNNIAVLSTVINFDLYHKTARLYPDNIQKFVVDGRKGMYGFESLNYFYKKSKDLKIKYLILADEDVVFKDFSLVFDIIDDMEFNKIHVVGPRDGGSIVHRNQNPYLMNTFFNILDWEKVTENWNKKEILQNQYIHQNEFESDFSKLIYNYDVSSLYEPYYCFYLWLRRRGLTFEFLESNMHEDGISNHLLHDKKHILTHTWYARSYGKNEKHTTRIDNILSETLISSAEVVNFVKYKDQIFALRFVFLNLIKNIKKCLKSIFE